jgi:hypothetical protein
MGRHKTAAAKKPGHGAGFCFARDKAKRRCLA